MVSNTVSVACPFVTGLVPRLMPFSKNVTVPVSPDPVVGKTFAVSVVGAPGGWTCRPPPRAQGGGRLRHDDGRRVGGTGEEVRLPLYDAVTESDPRGNVVSSMLAELMPFVVDTTEPPRRPRSMNDTEPSGSAVPDVGLTVAVSVTL